MFAKSNPLSASVKGCLLWSEFSIVVIWVQHYPDLSSVLLWPRSALAMICAAWMFPTLISFVPILLGWWVRFELVQFLSFLLIPNLLGEWVPLNNYKHLIGQVHGNCSLLRRLKWLFNIAIDVREELDWANFSWNSAIFQWFHWCLRSTLLCLYRNLWIPNP